MRGQEYTDRVRSIMHKRNWNRAKAQQKVYKDVLAQSSLWSRLRAFSRNLSNYLRNPNQFLSVLFYRHREVLGQEWAPDTEARPHIQPDTHGGQYFDDVLGKPGHINRYMQPLSSWLGIYLNFNRVLYFVVVAGAIAFLVTGLVPKFSNRFYVLCLPFFLGPLSLTWFHPAHGRYVLSLLPLMIVCFAYGVGGFSRMGWKGGLKQMTCWLAVFLVTLGWLV